MIVVKQGFVSNIKTPLSMMCMALHDVASDKQRDLHLIFSHS